MNFGQGLDFKIWENKGLHPLVNFNFTLQVEGIYNLPCKSVRVFQRENEYEYYQEGGLNDYVHMLRKPISKPMTFQVERYVGVDMFDPLALGTDLILPVLLSVSRYQGEGGSGGWKQPQRIYTFTGCTVMSKEFGELDAEKSGLLLETTTISYREMVCLDNPSTGLTMDSWSLKNDKDEAGRPKTKFARLPDNMYNKEKMEKQAFRYVDDKAAKQSPGVQNYAGQKISTVTDEKTKETTIGIAAKNKMASKAEMEKKARRYVDEKATSQSLGVKNYTGKKISTVTNETTKETTIGIAAKNKMTPRAEMEKSARRYVDEKATSQSLGVKNYTGQKVSTVTNETTNETTIGIATKNKMTPRAELEKKARRYYFDQSLTKSDYVGIKKSSAKVQKELNQSQMEAKAKRYYDPKLKDQPEYAGTVGTSATTKTMETQAAREKKAERYFLAGSKTKGNYKGKSEKNAATQKAYTGTDALTRSQMEKAAKRHFMEGSKAKTNYAGLVQSSARTEKAPGRREMEKTARRYFMSGSKLGGFYSGSVKASAETKPATKAVQRKWPAYRSAAQVAAFLKKR